MKIKANLNGLTALRKTAQRRRVYTERQVAANLLKAGYFLQRESMKIVPVHTGVLRASANTRAIGNGLDREVRVGYGTNYALRVHEDLEAAHGTDFNTKHAERIAAAPAGDKYWFLRGPNQQAKYLEQPIREKWDRLRQIVRGG